MKIKDNDEIRSLFGYFDHKVPLKTDDRITIIHGPNGVGKDNGSSRLIYDLFESAAITTGLAWYSLRCSTCGARFNGSKP